MDKDNGPKSYQAKASMEKNQEHRPERSYKEESTPESTSLDGFVKYDCMEGNEDVRRRKRHHKDNLHAERSSHSANVRTQMNDLVDVPDENVPNRHVQIQDHNVSIFTL